MCFKNNFIMTAKLVNKTKFLVWSIHLQKNFLRCRFNLFRKKISIKLCIIQYQNITLITWASVPLMKNFSLQCYLWLKKPKHSTDTVPSIFLIYFTSKWYKPNSHSLSLSSLGSRKWVQEKISFTVSSSTDAISQENAQMYGSIKRTEEKGGRACLTGLYQENGICIKIN